MKWVRGEQEAADSGFLPFLLPSPERVPSKGMTLGQIHRSWLRNTSRNGSRPDHRVAVNRELAALSAMFSRCLDWGKWEGVHPVRKG